MTTPKLCPETIKACIEALPVPYTLNPHSVVQCVAECRKALEALRSEEHTSELQSH